MSGFSRHARLTSRRDFQVVFDQPKKITRQNWQLLYRQNALTYPRLGIIISKQAVKHAVARNRLRRLVRESFRKQQEHIPAVDVVLIARYGCAELENKNIREQVDNLWPFIRF